MINRSFVGTSPSLDLDVCEYLGKANESEIIVLRVVESHIYHSWGYITILLFHKNASGLCQYRIVCSSCLCEI